MSSLLDRENQGRWNNGSINGTLSDIVASTPPYLALPSPLDLRTPPKILCGMHSAPDFCSCMLLYSHGILQRHERFGWDMLAIHACKVRWGNLERGVT